MLKKAFYYFKKYWHYLALAVLAIIFFLSTASFNFFTQSYQTSAGYDYVKWASPDETANYTFAKLYAQEGRLTLFEANNLYIKDLIHPRSFRSDWGNLKPVSFLGLILIYGKIAAVTTYKIIPYLTPLFGALGLIFYYLLVKEIFNRRNALISAFLLATFPVYIYYSARSMFHNVLFVVLLLVSLYCAVIMNKPWRYKYLGWAPALASGLFCGLAIITRTSELLWLGPLFFILWLFNVRKTGLTKVVIFVAGLVLAVLPALYYNQVLYSSYYLSGYPDMNRSLLNIRSAGLSLVGAAPVGETVAAANILEQLKKNIFYFGLNFYQSAKMFYFYVVEMFYWLFWPAVAGFVAWLLKWRRLKYRQLVYVVGLFILSAILVIYYGSWEFHDNPDPLQHTIGNSYTRYWLPIYLGLIPFASLLILRLTRVMSHLAKLLPNPAVKVKEFFSFQLQPVYIKIFFRSLVLVAVLWLAADFVLFTSSEGLYYLAQRQTAARAEWSKVLNLTETNAVIITRYHDKLFFPERKVIIGLFDDPNMIAEYAVIAQKLPTYYYNFTFPAKDFDFLNRSRLAAVNLQIAEIKQVTGDFTLYKLDYVTASSTIKDVKRK